MRKIEKEIRGRAEPISVHLVRKGTLYGVDLERGTIAAPRLER
jgi:hypothetical protein